MFDPVEFLGRLAVLVPRPRINLILSHGVLGPRAAWRSEVVRRETSEDGRDAVDHLRRRFLWAIAAVIVLAVVGSLELFSVSRFGEEVEEHIRSWTTLLFFYIAGWALAVCLHVTRVTRKILRGIELLSNQGIISGRCI